MANLSQSLSQAIPGLFRERLGDAARSPKSLLVAPPVFSNGRNEYQILSTDLRLDLRDPSQGGALAANADFVEGNIEYDIVTVATQRYASSLFKISQRTIDGLEGVNAALDLARNAEDACASQLFSKHRNLVSGISGVSAPSAGTLALGTLSTDLKAYFNSVHNEITLGSTKAPNYVYMNKKTYIALSNMDTIQEGAAIAAGPLRTGFVNFGVVDAFFAIYGLEVVVEDGSYINASGSATFFMDGKLLIGHRGGAASSLMTFAQDLSLARFYVQENVLPTPAGISVAADMQILVTAVDSSSARMATVTY